MTPSGATFSKCGKYRYRLWRTWPGGFGIACFVGLNPSTADAYSDDPTIRRCRSFAQQWGYGAMYMVNLFAFRATKPTDMMRAADPIGPENDVHLLECARFSGVVVACWGVDGKYLRRDVAVRGLLPNLTYLHMTKDGHPGHPLYLKKTCEPVLWSDIA